MTNDSPVERIQIMPYSMIVGQERLKLALELAYVAPRIGGVLLSGQRGTGKSTVVRAFGVMIHEKGQLPVTLPINATEDRVVGGWDIEQLLQNQPKLVPQKGLLEEANGGLLYIDEVNLLDDHIINIILDVTATGVLTVEREGKDERKEVRFILVGTMNPAEGLLRPQLLDRFGLMVDVTSEDEVSRRADILEVVLDFDAARWLEKNNQQGESLLRLQQARKKDQDYKQELQQARKICDRVKLDRSVAECCARIGKEFQAEGHRGDYIMALAARARAALRKDTTVKPEDILEVAPLALQHRCAWSPENIEWVKQELERSFKSVKVDSISGGSEPQGV